MVPGPTSVRQIAAASIERITVSLLLLGHTGDWRPGLAVYIGP